mmetsp:Transcript_28779/g.52574  ORF Transcript_28779/g.52574 Transcript_28779/m.52574 type:complete len:117 (+) Transcript_28779:197-547(+)
MCKRQGNRRGDRSAPLDAAMVKRCSVKHTRWAQPLSRELMTSYGAWLAQPHNTVKTASVHELTPAAVFNGRLFDIACGVGGRAAVLIGALGSSTGKGLTGFFDEQDLGRCLRSPAA